MPRVKAELLVNPYSAGSLARENLPEVEAYPVVSGSIDRLFNRRAEM
jgi:hypothetical protein